MMDTLNETQSLFQTSHQFRILKDTYDNLKIIAFKILYCSYVNKTTSNSKLQYRNKSGIQILNFKINLKSLFEKFDTT